MLEVEQVIVIATDIYNSDSQRSKCQLSVWCQQQSQPHSKDQVKFTICKKTNRSGKPCKDNTVKTLQKEWTWRESNPSKSSVELNLLISGLSIQPEMWYVTTRQNQVRNNPSQLSANSTPLELLE